MHGRVVLPLLCPRGAASLSGSCCCQSDYEMGFGCEVFDAPTAIALG
jgi:hypothetical protein